MAPRYTAPMNLTSPSARIVLVFVLAMSLSACGNKGPLVQAERPAPVEAPETAPGAVPVEMAPEPVTVDPATVDPAATDPAAIPSSELEPLDTPATELPLDPTVEPEPEVDEPVIDPPIDAPADDASGG